MPFSPHDAATHALARAQAMLDVSDPQGGMDTETAEDIWRMSLVMAVAALDTYMHRLVVGRAYSHDQLPESSPVEFPSSNFSKRPMIRPLPHARRHITQDLD